MALRKNYSTEIKDLDTLKQIAAALGLVQTRGQHRGEGSIRRLLEAIASGDVRIVRAPENRAAAEPMEKVLGAMAAAGLLEPSDPNYAFPQVTPIEIAGPPLSEQVIADRR